MLALPERPPRVIEGSILRASLIALNRLPNVRAMRNQVGRTQAACAMCRPKLCARCFPNLVRSRPYGLGLGSPDLVGLITIAAALPIGIPFGLEFKTPHKRTNHKARRRTQGAWRSVAIRRGMLCDEVTSVDEAVAAVEGFRVEMTRRVLVLS